jgi:hypothetical protein
MLPNDRHDWGGVTEPDRWRSWRERSAWAHGARWCRLAERYRSAGRAEKGRVLDELCAVTGWHRKHAVRTLRRPSTLAPVETEERVSRKRRYGAAMVALWEASDPICGKRLKVRQYEGSKLRAAPQKQEQTGQASPRKTQTPDRRHDAEVGESPGWQRAVGCLARTKPVCGWRSCPRPAHTVTRSSVRYRPSSARKGGRTAPAFPWIARPHSRNVGRLGLS